MKKIKKSEFITTDWSGGTTSEIYISPADSSVSKRNFDYRISSATCDLDKSVFTDYSGFTRYITPLDGDMKIMNSEEEVNLKPYEVYEFKGSDSVTGYSKVRDYNLIIKSELDGDMYSLKVKETREVENTSKEMIIFNFNSKLMANGSEFEAFSAILIQSGEKIELSGSGNILICEIN